MGFAKSWLNKFLSPLDGCPLQRNKWFINGLVALLIEMNLIMSSYPMAFIVSCQFHLAY